MKINETRIISNYTIYYKHLNRHDTLFGGYTLFWLDEVMGMVVRKYSSLYFVTASIDSYQFIDGVKVNELLKMDSYVSRVGNKSLEVFTEVTAYNAEKREERLVGLATSTFALRKDMVLEGTLEKVEAETELEKFVVETYDKRKNNEMSIREFTKLYQEKYLETREK